MNRKQDYIFSSEIIKQLNWFRGYLHKHNLSESTIRQKCNYAGYFLTWLEKEHLQPENTRYNDLLNFIDYSKLEGKSKKHVNTMLISTRNYYEFLKKGNKNIINPALNLHLKGIRQKVPSNIIAFKELEKLYTEYPATDNRTKRNKIMLGLLVYQGITTEELHKLEPGHIKLREGKIYVPGGKKRNSRTLELKSFQILELHEYLNETRIKIITEISKPRPARLVCRPGRKPDKINKGKLENQLFISINGSENLKNSLLHLFRAVQKINPEIKNPKQIRASVITNWLKHYNLRQVQYFAGHRYVSSTERYQMNNLDKLQEQIIKYHPLK